MTYTVAITKQGQMSIPVAIRDFLGFTRPGRATVTVVEEGLLVKPTKDIMSLAGILHDHIRLPKGYEKLNAQEIIRLEKEAARKAHVKRYEKSLR